MGVYLDRNGPNKQAHRLKAINYGGNFPIKVALFLPGKTQRCIREALNNSLVNPNTFIIAADNEAVPGTCQSINKFLEDNFTNFYLYKGKIEELDLTQLINNYTLPKIGFAFLDFCGPLTGSRGKWLTEQLLPNTSFGSKLAFTFSTSPRSRIGKSLFELAADKYGIAWERIFENSIRHVPDYIQDENSLQQIKSLRTTVALANAICPEVSLEKPSVYIDNMAPMVLCLGRVNTNTLANPPERKLLYHQKSNKYKFKETSMKTATELVQSYKTSKSNKKKLTEWKRQLTMYCNRRATETGRTPSRFRAGVKMVLTKAGFDTTQL